MTSETMLDRGKALLEKIPHNAPLVLQAMQVCILDAMLTEIANIGTTLDLIQTDLERRLNSDD